MDFGIAGKVALVTGGSRGIGFAIAEELAREGCKVVVASRGKEAVDAAVARLQSNGGTAMGVQLDVGDKEQIERGVKAVHDAFGTVDIFVYSNGGTRNMTFDNASDEDYLHAHLNVVMGFVWVVQAVLPGMKAKHWGRIVTVSSMCVKEPHRDYPLITHNMSRPAAVGVSKTMANDFGQYGVTVNTLATGTIDTDLFRNTWRPLAPAMNTTLEEIIDKKRSLIPVKRLGTPADMAAMCAFLCSDRAGFVTGQTIAVDGGRVLSLL